MNKQISAEMAKVSARFNEQKQLRLLGKKAWAYPIQLAEIQMKTVVRSQMDVLMKMILKILERLEVKEAGEISELLAVEVIFVDHMLQLMIRGKMVEKQGETYRLTASGLAHLQEGTFEQDPSEETVEIAYSPFHQDGLLRDENQLVWEADSETEDFQFNLVSQVTEQEDSAIKRMIEDSGYGFLVEKGQKIIDGIETVEIKESVRVLCFEYHLYDRTEDVLFIRVWNTWTGKFDVLFEDEISQTGASRLRKEYVERGLIESAE